VGWFCLACDPIVTVIQVAAMVPATPISAMMIWVHPEDCGLSLGLSLISNTPIRFSWAA
jgi:hypothetical protein